MPALSAFGAFGTETSDGVDVAVEQRGDALAFALERDHLVVLADLHLEHAQHHGGALVVVGGAGAAIAERLAA